MSSRLPSKRALELSPMTRILLIIVGWLLVALGIAGLVLPGLQGILTLIFGAAVLSLVSRRALRVLRYCFKPWPLGWRRLLRLRRRLADWLEEKGL